MQRDVARYFLKVAFGPVAVVGSAVLFAVASGCATSSGAGDRKFSSQQQSASTPDASSADDAEWSELEREWLEGETAGDFKALMVHLERTEGPSAAQKRALRRRLESWPGGTRVAPKSWLRRVRDGESVELFELVRVVDLRDVVEPDDSGRPLLEFLARDAVRRAFEQAELRRLTLPRVRPSEAAIELLGHLESLEGLTHLSFGPSKFLGEEDARALANAEALSGVTHLDLTSSVANDGMKALAKTDELTNVRRLDLSNSSIQKDGAKALGESELVSSVTHFHGEQGFGPEAIRVLVQSEKLDGLEYLGLKNSTIASRTLEAVAESPVLGELKRLELQVGRDEVSLDAWRSFAGSEVLDGVRRLEIAQAQFGADALGALANSPHLQDLRRFHLIRTKLDTEAVEAFVQSNQWSSLKRLELSGNDLSYDAAAKLTGSNLIDGLVHLRLSGSPPYGNNNRVGPRAIEQLARSSNADQLRVLRVGKSRKGIGDAGLAALADSEHLDALRRLELPGQQIRDRGLRELAESSNLGELTTLDLSANDFGPEGLRALATSEKLSGLEELRLADIDTDASALQTLLHTRQLTELRSLILDGSDVSGASDDSPFLRAFRGEETLTSLEKLSLERVGLGGDGATAVAHSEALTSVEELNLSNNVLYGRGVKALAESDYTSRLERLRIRDTKSSRRTLRVVANSNSLPRLQWIDATENNLTELEVAELRSGNERVTGLYEIQYERTRHHREPWK